MKVPPGLPQNQEGFLVDLVEGTQKRNLLPALTSQMEGWLLTFYPLKGHLCYFLKSQGQVLQLKDLVVGLYLQDFQVDLYQPEEGSQLKIGNDPQWSLKSPPPDKDWVGVEDVDVSIRVQSDSLDVVVSGDVWVDLNSISDSESESESCGKVLLCVSDCLGLWSARLTNRAWVIFHIKNIYTITTS